MKENTLLGIVLAVALFGVVSAKGDNTPSNNNSSNTNNSNQNYFQLPDGRQVPESDLPSLGYVKYYGRWVKQADLIAAMQANNITNTPQQNTPDYWALVNTILQTGLGLTMTIINNTAEQKKALIDDIMFKYTVVVSTNYDSNFPYTRSELNTKTIKQLKNILAGNYTISGLEQKHFQKTFQACNL